MSLVYEDFLLIVEGTPGAYTVEGRGPGEIHVPPTSFSYIESAALSADLEGVRQGSPPPQERMEVIGGTLFNALFPLKIYGAYERARSAIPPGAELRLKIDCRPPELSHLPWELLFDPYDRRYLAVQLTVPVVRYIASGKPVKSLLAKRPLRVLYLSASPTDSRPLNVQASEQALRDALDSHATIHVVENATPEKLRLALQSSPGYHILHYDGHGAFRQGSGQSEGGVLEFVNDRGERYDLDGRRLATYLDGTSVRLVVLGACETGMASTTGRLAGVAHELMQNSTLPAVVAMQYDIPDPAAIAFVSGFYRALADDFPVDGAMIQGRKAILELSGGQSAAFASATWATPVLFMRTRSGTIFEVSDAKSPEGEARESQGGERVLDTGGGANVEAPVNVPQGDFVGRDKVEMRGGFYQPGMTVHGDLNQAAGDMTIVGRASSHSPDVLARVLAPLHSRVNALPTDEKEMIRPIVQQIGTQLEKMQQGDTSPETRNMLEKRLRLLASIDRQVAESLLAGLVDPASGISLTCQAIARKVQAEVAGTGPAGS